MLCHFMTLFHSIQMSNQNDILGQGRKDRVMILGRRMDSNKFTKSVTDVSNCSALQGALCLSAPATED